MLIGDLGYNIFPTFQERNFPQIMPQKSYVPQWDGKSVEANHPHPYWDLPRCLPSFQK